MNAHDIVERWLVERQRRIDDGAVPPLRLEADQEALFTIRRYLRSVPKGDWHRAITSARPRVYLWLDRRYVDLADDGESDPVLETEPVVGLIQLCGDTDIVEGWYMHRIAKIEY